MKKFIVLKWMARFGLLLVIYGAIAHAATSQSELRNTLRSLSKEVHLVTFLEHDAKKHLGALNPLLTDEAIDALSSAERHSLYLIAATLNLKSGREQPARVWLEAARHIRRLDDANIAQSFLPLALKKNWHGISLDLINTATEKKLVHVLSSVTLDSIRDALRLYPDDETDKKNTLIQSLFDAGYKEYGTLEPNGLWLTLVKWHVKQGSIVTAKRIIAQMDDSELLFELYIDKRYHALFDSKAFLENLGALEKKRVETLRSMIATNDTYASQSTSLEYRLVKVLHRVGRQAEALAAADRTLEVHQKTPNTEFEENWMRDLRANILKDLGRVDEAIEELEKASRLDERGSVNVSQTINLANMLCAAGRDEETLKTLERVKKASDYGMSLVRMYKWTAYHQLGRVADAETILNEFAEDTEKNELIYFYTLVRAGDETKAAELLIKLLNDENQRARVLDLFQDKAVPENLLPRELEWQKMEHAILIRPDVRAAFDTVGIAARYDPRF